ncbi:MAG: hypothetical protein GX938_09255, partial [Spirochaetales bacterium]|nr:hypothetical protein [Spirochaetales bacterium]
DFLAHFIYAVKSHCRLNCHIAQRLHNLDNRANRDDTHSGGGNLAHGIELLARGIKAFVRPCGVC